METEEKPAIVLVRPQLGMNIGMVARAMGNFALDDLRLVSPRDGWPNPDTGPTAAGADHIIGNARLGESVAQALDGCQLTFATTARPRQTHKPVLTPREAARKMRTAAAQGLKSGILFGPERSGLTADDLAAIDIIITCPVNPAFSSLNLAQAVILVAYEWYASATRPEAPNSVEPPAPYEERAAFLDHLDRALEEAGYFHVPARAPSTKRSIADLVAHASFSSNDLRMLHGIVRILAEHRQETNR